MKTALATRGSGARKPPPRVRRRSVRQSLGRLLVLLLSFALLHSVAMIAFEGLTPFEAVWLTMTTMTTVGYGDFSAETPLGRLSTMLLVFLGGIWLAFQTAATWFEYRAERRERMRRGRWRWNMSEHILILNVPANNAGEYLKRLVGEFRESTRFASIPIQVVCRCFADGLPDELTEAGVVHTDGEPWDQKILENAGVALASHVVVLALSDTDPGTDGRTLDIVDRVRSLGAKGRVLAESVDDANRPRLRRFGADTVVRPLRAYPEMIVRALAAPGAEQILEDLFTSRRDECWRYDVRIRGVAWGDIVATLVREDIGVPIAYRAAGEDRIGVNPPPQSEIHADKLFVLVREGNARPDAEVEALITGGRGGAARAG